MKRRSFLARLVGVPLAAAALGRSAHPTPEAVDAAPHAYINWDHAKVARDMSEKVAKMNPSKGPLTVILDILDKVT